MMEGIKIADIRKVAKEYRQLFRLHEEKKIFVFTDESMHTPEDGKKTELNYMQDSLSDLMMNLNISQDNSYSITVECLNFLEDVTEEQLENISFEAEEAVSIYTSEMIKLLMSNYNDMEYMNEVIEEENFSSYTELFQAACKRMYIHVWTSVTQFIEEAAQEDQEAKRRLEQK